MGSKAGVLKAAATRLGLSLAEYRDQQARGLKRCVNCRRWRPRHAFNHDRSRGAGLAAKCRTCHNEASRASYVAVAPEHRVTPGPARIARRAGYKKQARSRINHDVAQGLRPHPNDLPCARCGHRGPGPRHEYHHHMGYEPQHHGDVVPLCSPCHREEHAHG